MRILAANPDGMGDLILRQPMYSALASAGHELMLTVRAQYVDLAREIFPQARCEPIPVDPYPLAFDPEWEPLDPLLAVARDFSPDIFLVSPFQWTLLEERLAEALPEARVLGMKGVLYAGDPRWGIASESKMRFDAQVAVAENLPELTKNELLTSLVLGRPAKLKRPRMTASKDAVEAGLQELLKLGLKKNRYWIGCVGTTKYTQVKNWTPQNWAAALTHWAKRHGRKFLLVGTEQEREATLAVYEQMSPAARQSAFVLCGETSLQLLAALAELSRGYVGRDTGVMHLAAALGKPVIAVFGGGHWPRFQPAASPSWVGMVRVPCIGCHWRCPFETSHCVKDVPLKNVCRAIDQLESGKLTGRQVQELTPSRKVYQIMARQAMEKMKERTFEIASIDRNEMARRDHEWEARLSNLREELTRPPDPPPASQPEPLSEPQISDEIPAEAPVEIPAETPPATPSETPVAEKIDEPELASVPPPSEPIISIAVNRSPWPYSAPDSPPLPKTLPGGKPWPKISVVTPTFNQGKYVEQTILSVLNHGYPNLEYIFMDGGSTDQTMSIVERYRDRIQHVVSEKDRGQSHAINKGFALATGTLCTWLNSDDMFEPGALAAMAMAFEVSGADMVAGVCTLQSDGKTIGRHLTSCADGPLPLDDLLDIENCWMRGQFFHQPEVMFTKDLWDRAGGHVDEKLFYSMDYEMWLRFAEAGARLHVIGRSISLFRVHQDQKTFNPTEFRPELMEVQRKFLERTGKPTPPRAATRSRTSLKVAFFNDIGNLHGAGIAHERLSAAMALAGHQIVPLAIHPNLVDCELTNDEIVSAMSQREPDLVVLGNIHAARLDPAITGLIADRWPAIQVMHDFYPVTGRCAYTGDCTKYLHGCDDSCPTPHEYPTLDRSLIKLNWEKKDRILRSPNSPILAGNSRWTEQAVRARFGQNNGDQLSANSPSIIGLRLGLPLEVFRPRDKTMCRELLGLPQDRFLILFSSSQLADVRKGLPHLIEAMDQLKLPDSMAVCVGNFAVEHAFKDVEVRAMGYLDDPHSLAMLYSAVDLYVGPSQVETFGQVFIEAAACGTPAIGYATAGGVAESVADGLSGRLVATPDSAALAEMIKLLHDNPVLRRDMSVWGRLWIENEYSLFTAYHRIFSQLRQIGVTDKLGMPPKISFFCDVAATPAVTYLQPATPAPAVEPAVHSGGNGMGNGAYAQLQSRVASLEAERDSLRIAMHNVTHTRLWRMVGQVYPVYQRVLSNPRFPRFMRQSIESMGRWLAAKPKARR